MNLIGYVSDERYVALHDVALEFRRAGQLAATARSTASGAVYADLMAGEYEVIIAKDGFGAKRVVIHVDATPYQFRLLSNRLLGYVWPKWARAGEASEFRVHSSCEYKLSLWRYGWEKEFIRNLGWWDNHGPRTTTQLTPDGDYTQTGVQWNRIGYQLKWQPQRVFAPARSGLYFFHAKNAAGEFYSFPWIVMPATPQAEVAVLTCNLTWNAYNSFGGRSNYVNQDALPPTPIIHARQDLQRYTQPDTWPFEIHGAPLSFDRPEPFNVVPENARITDPIEGRLESAMAPAEWRLLGWLEREGFAYDLYSETELHFGRLDLDRYKVLVLNTHPEYWTKEMFFQVKRWVDERGGKLMYLGGCALLCELEFLDEHTMICRQEERRDLRGVHEATLLGVAYSHAGYQSGAPYRVLDAAHWVFAGTGLRNGDLFGERSLHERCPGGASAHELDKISPHSPPNLVHLAKGNQPNDDGADMVLFDTPSGGAVFSVGSLAWPLSMAIDAQVSRVTRNVLERFLS